MRGYTFLELLIAIGLVAIFALTVPPALNDFFTKNRALAKVNEIVAALQYARSEAIVRNARVKFCATADGHTCSGEWGNGQLVLTAPDEVLLVLPRLVKSDQLLWHGGFGRDGAVVFSPFGFLATGAGRFEYNYGKDQSHSCAIIISSSGRIRVENDKRL